MNAIIQVKICIAGADEPPDIISDALECAVRVFTERDLLIEDAIPYLFLHDLGMPVCNDPHLIAWMKAQEVIKSICKNSTNPRLVFSVMDTEGRAPGEAVH